MAEAFATIQDMIALFRPLSAEETERAKSLLPVISDRLRIEARKTGRDLDQMIEADEILASVAKSVTVDITARTLNTPTTGDMAPLSQYSQSGLGYTVSGTFLSGGGGIFIKKSELSALGIHRQRIGVLNMMGGDEE